MFRSEVVEKIWYSESEKKTKTIFNDTYERDSFGTKGKKCKASRVKLQMLLLFG